MIEICFESHYNWLLASKVDILFLARALRVEDNQGENPKGNVIQRLEKHLLLKSLRLSKKKTLETPPERGKICGPMPPPAAAWSNSQGIDSGYPAKTNAMPEGDRAPAPSSKITLALLELGFDYNEFVTSTNGF